MLYEYLHDVQWMNVFITYAAFILFMSQFIWLYNIIHSLFRGKKAEENPWQANTVDWTAPTPVPHGNFVEPMTVYRSPYEYSVPDVEADWIAQTQK